MIHVKELRYAYPGQQAPALQGLQFDVQDGEIFGFLGPSGAGKSTTQKILIRLLQNYDGSVKIDGKEVSEWSNPLYERIGVAFEFPNHFSKLTAIENLETFAAFYGRSGRQPIELLQILDLQDAAGMRVGHFSKGMKNRLSLARALLHDPDLLFLDEPTAGLDPVNVKRVHRIIQEQQDQGKTIFLTTHDMSTAEALCDRIAFIVAGQLAVIDSPAALKQRYGKRTLKMRCVHAGKLLEESFPLDGLAANARFQQLLQEAEIQIMHSQEAGLAEVFIDVTGEKL